MTENIKDEVEEKTDEVEWLKKHSEASMTLFNIVCEIRGLAQGFKTTGNKVIYNQLILIAVDIEKANKDMSDAIGESISEYVKRSGESSKAILEAALAGVLMESTNPTKKGKKNELC